MKKAISILIFFPLFSFGQWNQVGNSISGTQANGRLGWSTAISGNGSVVATGAIFASSGGQVTAYGLSNGSWSQIGVPIDAESGGDQTGQSVSLSEDGLTLAIGEPFNNDLGFTSGQVRVFRNINNTWTQIGQDLYGQNALAGAGTMVSLSADGNTVAFGAPNTTVSGFSGFTGNVEVYQLQGSSWVQKGSDINGDGSIIKFGTSVSLSNDGNIVAIGHTGDPGNMNSPQFGRVKVYQFINNQWTQIGNTIFGLVNRDEFGNKVSLSALGNMLAISTFSSNVVLVYQLNGGVWTQLGNLMSGENIGDGFGSSISLSDSGTRIAIGARFYTNLSNMGRAYVYENQSGIWTLINNPIFGVFNDDLFGISIAITGDGSKVVVGATNNDAGGNNAGQVRVFENTSILNIGNQDRTDFVKIFPNPTSNYVQIKSSAVIDSYSLFSVEGKIVKSERALMLNDVSIDMTDLSSGVYFLETYSNGTIKNNKIIKQ